MGMGSLNAHASANVLKLSTGAQSTGSGRELAMFCWLEMGLCLSACCGSEVLELEVLAEFLAHKREYESFFCGSSDEN